eukprot:998755-Pelagomonas_calceolata.AAC.2
MHEHVFQGDAMRIRLHFLQAPDCGVAKCTAGEDKLEPVEKVMLQLGSREKEQQAAQDRQGDRATAPAKKQRTLADCVCNPTEMGTEGLLIRASPTMSPAICTTRTLRDSHF